MKHHAGAGPVAGRGPAGHWPPRGRRSDPACQAQSRRRPGPAGRARAAKRGGAKPPPSEPRRPGERG